MSAGSVQLLNAKNLIPIDLHPRMKVDHEDKGGYAYISPVLRSASRVLDGNTENVSLNLSDTRRSGGPWTTAKRRESLNGDFEQFFLPRSSISFNITQLDSAQLREIQRFSALISRSWVTDWVPSGFHLLPRLKERLRWHQHASEDDSRQWLIFWSLSWAKLIKHLWQCEDAKVFWRWKQKFSNLKYFDFFFENV